jgi:hypothetical protein
MTERQDQPMKTHILRGSKQEIAESLIRLNGEIHEAIVFEEETVNSVSESANGHDEDIFAEMEPYTVNVNDVDDSREAIYTRADGE